MLIAKCINNINPFTNEIEKGIELNENYEVDSVDMGQSSTTISLVDVAGWFNSIYFEFFEHGELINIYNDPRYNPYL